MLQSLEYYFFSTYRRKILDRLLQQNKHYFKGVVLDIGGGDKGKFKKPKDKVDKWIFADISEENSPDIVLDVANMSQIASNSIDIILSTELFEHVSRPEQGLKECFRVLKEDGNMILSAPFLTPIHADPWDFQRWTEEKWKKEVDKAGFKTERFEIAGRYFTVLFDMKRKLIKSMPKPLRWFLFLFYPLFDLVVLLDSSNMVKKSRRLSRFHGGYFIILRK